MKTCLLDYLNSVLHLNWKKKKSIPYQHSSPFKLYQAKNIWLDNTSKNPAALGEGEGELGSVKSGVSLHSLAEGSSQEDVLKMILS